MRGHLHVPNQSVTTDHLAKFGAGTDNGDAGKQLIRQVRRLHGHEHAYRAADGHDDPTCSRSNGDDEVPDLFTGSMVDHDAGPTHAVDICFSVGQFQSHISVTSRFSEVGRQDPRYGVRPARLGLTARESLKEDVEAHT